MTKSKKREKLLIIGGPSGVGKTALSIKLAKAFNGEILSCDSMQIYKGFDLGTAKITKEEMEGIPHYMIDICEPSQQYSVAEYKDETKEIITTLNNQGKLPIMVGGTGLYISAVLYDYKFGGVEKDSELRQYYNALLAKYGNMVLTCELKKRGISYEGVHFNNSRRLLRLIETNGRKEEKSQQQSKYDFFYVCLTRDRVELYAILDKRVDKMFDLGLEQEVAGLISSGVSFDCQAMQSIGYKEFAPYYNGEIQIQEVKEVIKKNTRNYAKRQLTWFRNCGDATMYDVSNGFNDLIEQIGKWLKE